MTQATLQFFGASSPWGVGDDNLMAFPITTAWDASVIIFAPDIGASEDTVVSSADPVLTLTSLVQKWVDGTQINHGVLIDNEFNFNAFGNFFSSETTTGTPPSLTVEYFGIPEARSGFALGLAGLLAFSFRRQRTTH